MSLGTLLIRADASASMGSGHVMRCLALAERWQSGEGDVVFAMAESTSAIERRVADARCRISRIAGVPGSGEDLASTRDLVVGESPTWVVLDGYQFDADYQSELSRLGRLLLIDDNGGLFHYSADFVLNQNAHAAEAMYANRSQKTRLLLGPRYALLRNEFTEYRAWKREIPEPGTRILVSMGGSDPANLGPRVLLALSELPIEGLKIRVVVGGSATNGNVISELAQGCRDRAEVLRDPRNMAEQMSWADLGIVGAGTTCWEACCLGLPTILIVAAENQHQIARQMAMLGAAIHGGVAGLLDCTGLAEEANRLLASAERRRALSQSARQLVDGLGRDRVFDVLLRRDSTCA